MVEYVALKKNLPSTLQFHSFLDHLPQAKNICLLVGILNPGGLICSNRFLKLVDWTVSNLMEPKDLEIPAGSLRLQEESLMDAC